MKLSTAIGLSSLFRFTVSSLITSPASVRPPVSSVSSVDYDPRYFYNHWGFGVIFLSKKAFLIEILFNYPPISVFELFFSRFLPGLVLIGRLSRFYDYSPGVFSTTFHPFCDGCDTLSLIDVKSLDDPTCYYTLLRVTLILPFDLLTSLYKAPNT